MLNNCKSLSLTLRVVYGSFNSSSKTRRPHLQQGRRDLWLYYSLSKKRAGNQIIEGQDRWKRWRMEDGGVVAAAETLKQPSSALSASTSISFAVFGEELHAAHVHISFLVYLFCLF